MQTSTAYKEHSRDEIDQAKHFGDRAEMPQALSSAQTSAAHKKQSRVETDQESTLAWEHEGREHLIQTIDGAQSRVKGGRCQ